MWGGATRLPQCLLVHRVWSAKGHLVRIVPRTPVFYVEIKVTTDQQLMLGKRRPGNEAMTNVKSALALLSLQPDGLRPLQLKHL